MINESNLQKTSQKLLLFRLDLVLCHVWMWSIYDSTDFAFTHCLHLFRDKTSVQHFDLSFSIIWIYFWQPCRVLSMRIQQQLLSYLAMSYWLKKKNEMSLFFFFFLIYWRAWLICIVVLICLVQQSNSVICIHFFLHNLKRCDPWFITGYWL